MGCSEEPRAQCQQRQKQRLEFPPRSHVCRYSTRARQRWLFSDAPGSSEAQQGYGQSQRITRGRGELGRDPGLRTGRASDASRRSGRPARFALIASGPEPTAGRAELLRAPTPSCRAAAGDERPPSRAGRHRGCEAAGGGEAERGARAAGETRSGGSWKGSQRVGAAGGGGGGREGAPGEGGEAGSGGKAGSAEDRLLAAQGAAAAAAGLNHPFPPRGDGAGTAPSQTRPGLGRLAPRAAPGRALPRSPRAPPRTGWGRRLVGRRAGDARAPHPDEAKPVGSSATWRGPGRAEAGRHPPVSLRAWPGRSPPGVTWERNAVAKRTAEALAPGAEISLGLFDFEIVFGKMTKRQGAILMS